MSDKEVIFISYRRSDAEGNARNLHEYLSRRFGEERIFFDRSSIESGDVFPETLRHGVEGCAALLALIGPKWSDITGSDGTRRLDDPGDFVRREIALAFEHGKKVIPVLFDDTPVPPLSCLPKPLKALATCDALTLRGKTFEYKAQRRELVRLLAKLPLIPKPFPEEGEPAEPVVGIAPEDVSALVEVATRGFQQVSEAQRLTIAALEKQLGANEAQLQVFFQIIGEAQVPPEHRWARLNDIAGQYRELKAQLTPAAGDLPEVALLKEQARKALDDGQLEAADELLAEIERAQDAALDKQWRQLERHQREFDRRQLERAATTAQRGSVALTRLRYREAARHFGAAARFVPREHESQALAYKDQEGDSLCRQGDEFGDNVALADAIRVYKELLKFRAREDAPLDWANTQHNLGTALTSLGERESGTARLEKAVIAFREALKERTRERSPLDWAQTQNNLGNALFRLGERQNGTIQLEEAVAAFREALKERTRECLPLGWAQSQNNLGNALGSLGQRESNTARLEEAVACYRAALKEWTRDRVPLLWAGTQNNLGVALKDLGRRQGDQALLKQAVAAFRMALQEWTRDRVPLRWAGTQNNLGTALSILGARYSSTVQLKRAVRAFREALQEWTRDQVPLQWAAAQNNLGSALSDLGERQCSSARLKDAVMACREALEEANRERVPLEWARAQNRLGVALTRLGVLENDSARLEDAVGAHREALKERTRERVPLDWAATQNDLGGALLILGERESGTARVEEAVAAYRAALQEWTRERVPLDWAVTQNNLGGALLILGKRESGTAWLEEAAAAYRAALSIFEPAGAVHYASEARSNLDRVKNLLAKRRGSSV